MRQLLPFLVALAAAIGGCVPSYSSGKADLNRHWFLTDMTADTTPAEPGEGEGFRMPVRVVVRRVADRNEAAASIDAAMAELKQGTDKLEFSVSDAHAADAAALLEEVRAVMGRMNEMLASADSEDRNRWASAMAGALVATRDVSTHLLGDAKPNGPTPQAVAAAEPILHMISTHLDEQSGGRLLADLSPRERRRLRSILTELVVQVGFGVAGKTAIAPVHREVHGLLAGKAPAKEVEARLTEVLTEKLADAPPAQSDRKRRIVRHILKWGPKLIDVWVSFLGQWDRMDSITVERLRRNGAGAVAATVAVRKGEEVRIADIMTGVPTVAMHGRTRIVSQSDATGAGEAVLAFLPCSGGGAVELRYEGSLFAAVRTMAIPLASGPLREIRVSNSSPAEGETLLSVTVLSEASGDKDDPRRMMVIHRTGRTRLVREVFQVKSVTEQSRTVVSYITPDKRYTYEKTEDGETSSEQ